MDKSVLLTSSLLAKKYKCAPYSETLLTHSLRVAEEAKREATLVFDKTNPHAPLFIELSWLCAFFHDIGKCDKDFQNFIKRNDETAEIISDNGIISHYHNIIGAILFNNYVNVYSRNCPHLNRGNLTSMVVRSIFHHHAPYPSDTYSIKYQDEYPTIMKEMVEIAKENLSCIDISFVDPAQSSYGKMETLELSADNVKYYTSRHDGFDNIYNFILDQVIKMSDIIISKPTSDPIGCFNKIHYRSIGSNTDDIVRPPHYDNRYDIQCEAAESLSQKKMSVFIAQPGFGKTGTGLHYILSKNMENRKAFWICPRNSIAEAVYNTLNVEIKNRRMGDKMKTALLLTNDWKEGNSDADIIVTNIDNFLRPILKNDARHRTFNMLNAVCIFDEFHEYVSMNTPMMAIFDLVLKARYMANCHTLLLSATPIMNFAALRKLYTDDAEAIRQHNDPLLDERIYNIRYTGCIDDLTEKLTDTLYQFHSRSAAQKYYDLIQLRSSLLIHSHFLETDRKRIFSKLLTRHGKDGINEDGDNCIATNIISTGIDVSFQNLVINLPSPDGLIQSLGRCNRWNDSKEHTLIVADILRLGGEEQAIRSIFGRIDIHTLFNKFLKKKLPTGPHKFQEIREVRDEFYKEYKEIYQKYFSDALRSSYECLPDIAYETAYKNDGTSDEIFVGKNILRASKNTNSFWCRLYRANGKPCEELYQGDTLSLGIVTDGSNRKQIETLVDFHIKQIKSNKNYPSTRLQRYSDKKEATAVFQIMLAQARSNKRPIHIPTSVCMYDSVYGIIKKKK